MFVSQETWAPVSFAAASARLADLTRSGALLGASEHAYDEGAAGLIRVGPAPGISRVVRVQFGELVTRETSVSLALRWEAAGRTGGLFPALDADIVITPAGDSETLLQLDGVYRAPLGALGEGLDSMVLHRVAMATIRAFAGRIAALIAHPSSETATELAARDWSPDTELG